jgi:hypothetical protein
MTVVYVDVIKKLSLEKLVRTYRENYPCNPELMQLLDELDYLIANPTQHRIGPYTPPPKNSLDRNKQKKRRKRKYKEEDNITITYNKTQTRRGRNVFKNLKAGSEDNRLDFIQNT